VIGNIEIFHAISALGSYGNRSNPASVGVHVPAKPDVQDIGIGLTTILEADKVPPDISTTGAPDMALV
jgi:hypothetical protein